MEKKLSMFFPTMCMRNLLNVICSSVGGVGLGLFIFLLWWGYIMKMRIAFFLFFVCFVI